MSEPWASPPITKLIGAAASARRKQPIIDHQKHASNFMHYGRIDLAGKLKDLRPPPAIWPRECGVLVELAFFAAMRLTTALYELQEVLVTCRGGS